MSENKDADACAQAAAQILEDSVFETTWRDDYFGKSYKEPLNPSFTRVLLEHLVNTMHSPTPPKNAIHESGFAIGVPDSFFRTRPSWHHPVLPYSGAALVLLPRMVEWHSHLRHFLPINDEKPKTTLCCNKYTHKIDPSILSMIDLLGTLVYSHYCEMTLPRKFCRINRLTGEIMGIDFSTTAVSKGDFEIKTNRNLFKSNFPNGYIVMTASQLAAGGWEKSNFTGRTFNPITGTISMALQKHSLVDPSDKNTQVKLEFFWMRNFPTIDEVAQTGATIQDLIQSRNDQNHIDVDDKDVKYYLSTNKDVLLDLENKTPFDPYIDALFKGKLLDSKSVEDIALAIKKFNAENTDFYGNTA